MASLLFSPTMLFNIQTTHPSTAIANNYFAAAD